MEWLAHTLTPAATGAMLGEFMLGKRLGNQALAWGAALALGPGVLDGLAGLLLPVAASLAFQGTATHSILVAAVVAVLLPRWLAPKWKRAKLTRSRIGWCVGLAWFAGPLFGGLTLPGVQWCWPIPAPRLTANLLAPGDALPGLVLLGCLLGMTMLRGKKEQAKRRRLAWWGCGAAGAYLVLALAGKLITGAGTGADLARRGVAAERRLVCPTAWNPLLWRTLADCGESIWIGHRSVWEWPSTPVRWTMLPRQREAFGGYRETPEARRLAANADGWWICRPNKTGLWLADLRYGAQQTWGERKGMVDLRCRRAWHFEPDRSGEPVHALRPEARPGGAELTRLARRGFADHQAMAGLPRLAGVPGALPEILETAE